MNVKGGAMTSSPGPKPAIMHATCKRGSPAVHGERSRITQGRGEGLLEIFHIFPKAETSGIVSGRKRRQRGFAKCLMLQGEIEEWNLHDVTREYTRMLANHNPNLRGRRVIIVPSVFSPAPQPTHPGSGLSP